MAQDSLTEVTQTSWLSRIGGAIKGILVGVVLFVVSFPLLFWNEGRSVKTYKTLKEGASSVVSVAADRVDEANAGRLVHATARANTDEVLRDAVFGVFVNALKLQRVVEMYQWEESSHSETRKKVGGGEEKTTTYSYAKDWSESLVKSSSFKQPEGHQNPASMPYESEKQTAKNVSFGAFTLSPSLVGKINNFEPLALDPSVLLPEARGVSNKLHGAGFYLGANPATPQIGDARVSFKVSRPAEVSVVARQVGTTFEPFRASAGGTIELLETGVRSADAMFEQAQASNRTLTWVLRLVGFVVMLAGLNMVFRPLSVVADVLPILGTIVGAGTGLIAFLLAAILSLVTVAIAWIVYRPLLGIALLVVAIGLAMAAKGKLKLAKGKATPAKQPA